MATEPSAKRIKLNEPNDDDNNTKVKPREAELQPIVPKEEEEKETFHWVVHKLNVTDDYTRIWASSVIEGVYSTEEKAMEKCRFLMCEAIDDQMNDLETDTVEKWFAELNDVSTDSKEEEEEDKESSSSSSKSSVSSTIEKYLILVDNIFGQFYRLRKDIAIPDIIIEWLFGKCYKTEYLQMDTSLEFIVSKVAKE